MHPGGFPLKISLAAEQQELVSRLQACIFFLENMEHHPQLLLISSLFESVNTTYPLSTGFILL